MICINYCATGTTSPGVDRTWNFQYNRIPAADAEWFLDATDNLCGTDALEKYLPQHRLNTASRLLLTILHMVFAEGSNIPRPDQVTSPGFSWQKLIVRGRPTCLDENDVGFQQKTFEGDFLFHRSACRLFNHAYHFPRQLSLKTRSVVELIGQRKVGMSYGWLQ